MNDRAVSGLTGSALLLLLLTLTLSLAVVGAVETWAVAVISLALASAFALRVADGGLSWPRGEKPWQWPETWASGLVLLCLFQALPLPAGLQRALSPEASRLWVQGAAVADEGAARALSLQPHATLVTALRLGGLALLYVALARGLRSRRLLTGLLAAVVALVATTALLGIVDHLGGTDLLRGYPREMAYPDRLTGPFVNPNSFAALLVLLVPLAAGLVARLGTGGPGRRSRSDGGAAGAVLLGLRTPGGAVASVAAVVLVTACLLTSSRMGMVALVAGAVIFPLAAARTGGSLRAAAVVSAAAALAVVAMAAAAADPVLGRWGVLAERASAGTARWDAWGAMTVMVRRFLLCGTGMGTFEHVFPAYQPTDLRGTWDRAHSDLLQWVIEGGLPALILAAGAALAWLRPIVRALHRARTGSRVVLAGVIAGEAALALHALADFPLQIPAIPLVAVVIAAMGSAWALGVLEEEGADGTPGGTPSMRTPSRPVSLAAGIAAVVLVGVPAVPLARQDLALRRIALAALRQRPLAATARIAALGPLSETPPTRPDLLRTLAEAILEEDGDGAAARADALLRRARRAAPTDARTQYGAGLALLLLGRGPEALGCMDRAAALAADRSGLLERLGEFHLRRWSVAGDPAGLGDALPFFRMATLRDPDRARRVLEHLHEAGLDPDAWGLVTPPEPAAQRELARRLLMAGRPAAAAAALDEVARAMPGNTDVMEEQAIALLRGGEIDRGLAILATRVASGADGDQVLKRAWEDLRRVPAEYRRGFLESSGGEGPWRDVLVARTLIEEGRTAEGLRRVAAVLRTEPRDGKVLVACYDMQASDWVRLESWSMAASCAERAASLDPTPERWAEVGRLHARAGDTGAARDAFATALRLATEAGGPGDEAAARRAEAVRRAMDRALLGDGDRDE